MVALSQMPYGFYDFSIHADAYLPLEVPNIEIFKDTMLTFEIAKDNPDITFKFIDVVDGEPLSRAIVTINGVSSFTDNEGMVTFKDITGNKIIFEANHNNYFENTDSIVVESDTLITVPMTRTRANVNFVIADSGNMLSNVLVSFAGRSDFTGTDGHVAFFNQPAHQAYDYKVSLDGYKTMTGSFFLHSDTTLTISLETVTNAMSAGHNDSFRIYPNPFKSHLVVFSNHSEGTMVLRDLQGRKLFEKQLVLGKQTFQFAGLPDGYYILNVKFGNHTQRVRVVKQSLINN
jgi:hypothetical protein